MFRTFGCHGEYGVGQRRFRRRQVFPGPLIGLNDPARQLPGLGCAEHDGVALHSDSQSVVLHDPVGIGVVGGNCGFQPVFTGFKGALPLRAVQRQELLPDASCQLAGRLAGKGDPEDLFRANQSVSDQPHHAVGHGLGLAGAGAGNDQ